MAGLGGVILGLRDEYMRKSKKELVAEILRLKQDKYFEADRDIKEMTAKIFINRALEEENKKLRASLGEYYQKYADEVQKRLELERIIEQMKEA